jgi:heme exporter protein D
MDIFLPILGLLMIMVFIVWATIRINSLMKGKIINTLLNKKLLLIVASILAFLYTLAFVIAYFDGFVFYWDDYLWLAFSIALIFVVANYIPSVVLFLKEVHQNNLEDIKEQELKEV